MTRKTTLPKIHAAAKDRKPGYIEAVLAAARIVKGPQVELGDEDFQRLRAEYALPLGAASKGFSGPGTELKKLLKRVRIVALPRCRCNKRAAIMDQLGCDWCEENIDTIVGWLREEAAKRGLPFLDAAGRMLVKRAIRNARRASVVGDSPHG
jgi:hypothetical protein